MLVYDFPRAETKLMVYHPTAVRFSALSSLGSKLWEDLIIFQNAFFAGTLLGIGIGTLAGQEHIGESVLRHFK